MRGEIMTGAFRKAVFFVLLLGLVCVGYQRMIKKANSKLAEAKVRLQDKLDKLFTFYFEQIQRGNLNDYKRIDLSYQDPVVAQRYY